jgi:hypothetical protein
MVTRSGVGAGAFVGAGVGCGFGVAGGVQDLGVHETISIHANKIKMGMGYYGRSSTEQFYLLDNFACFQCCLDL